jgi:hypothetical protein
MEKIKLCICGGGALGHVTAGFLSAGNKAEINILTTKPEQWSHAVELVDPDNKRLKGSINRISDDPGMVVPGCDIVLLCLPGFAIENELRKISPYLSAYQYIGSVVSSTGFFFMARDILPDDARLFGFQRVPFIARVNEYGKSAYLLGYKKELKVAGYNIPDMDRLSALLSELFNTPVTALENYLEAALSNSNPLLHTVRLFSLFRDYVPGMVYPKHYLFYEEWDDHTSSLLLDCDNEFHKILHALNISGNANLPLLKYYKSEDAASLTNKIRSIKAFKGLKSPMIKIKENEFVPNLKSRYFTEDFPYGLAILKMIADKCNVAVPQIDKVLDWGKKIIGDSLFDESYFSLSRQKNLKL